MQPLPERTEAQGLRLRRWRPADAPLQHDLVVRNVEHLRPWMAWIADEPLEVGDRRRLIERWEREWLDGGDAYFAILDAADGTPVGSCGLHRRIGPGGLEVGYWVDAGHLRRGVATRAARALTDLAFTVEGIDVVEILHDRTNVASRGVPEQLGFALAGDRPTQRPPAPADTGTDTVWRVTRAEWVRA